MSFRPLFCLFLSGRFRQDLLYPYVDLVFQHYYKSVTMLKTREDDIRRTRNFNKTRGEELKKGKHHLKYYPKKKNASENVVC